MFWEAVQRGIGVLWHWQTYAATLVYFAITFAPMYALNKVVMKTGSVAVALWWVPIFKVALQVAGLVFFVLTLWPIMLGVSTQAAWAVPWQIAVGSPGAFAGFIAKLCVVAGMLAFIPVLGRLNSLHTLALGGLAIALVVQIIDGVRASTVFNQVQFLPGFWFSIGLLAVGGLAARLAAVLAGVCATVLDLAMDGLGLLVIFPFSAIFGLFPLFIYSAWIGMQLPTPR